LSAPTSLIGRSYGSYKLVARLGEGGMGQVYRASHPDPSKKPAVKVLLPHLCEKPQVIGRFFNEAKAATRIQHPGIVEIYDYGTTEDGGAYIAMELLEGQSLAERIAAGKMEIPLVLEIAGQIAGALEAAHGEGIIHRDLKPDNLFLVADPSLPLGLRVKILDFGIAKLTEGSEVEATRAGMMMGTPRYMAPEQSRGAGSVDRTADLYALGCIVFEMLTGRPPFAGDTPGEMIAQHLIEDAPPLPTEFPKPIADAVMKALQKTPAQRWQFAVDFAKALGAPPASFAAARHRPVKGPTSRERRAQPGGGARGAVPDSKAEGREAANRLLKRLPSVETSGVGKDPPLAVVVVAAVVLAAAVAALFVQIGRKQREVPAPPPEVAAKQAVAAAPDLATLATVDLATAAPAAVEPVRFVISSKPTGAEVYRVADGVRVGTTPYTTERAPTDGMLVFSVQKKGYKEVRVEFPADRGSEADVELHHKRAEPKPDGTDGKKTEDAPAEGE
jgi:hypothetical protein